MIDNNLIDSIVDIMNTTRTIPYCVSCEQLEVEGVFHEVPNQWLRELNRCARLKPDYCTNCFEGSEEEKEGSIRIRFAFRKSKVWCGWENMRLNDLAELPVDKPIYWYTKEVSKAEKSVFNYEEWINYFKLKIRRLNEIKENLQNKDN